ncbi:hypothetical protein MKY59_30530 [Paenibacillus sp. FSL W8-0426]|uniref:hypothetical protein n=1 Tax=Paenibacillus sp. FSL W8-0426 TaxID=2921714 RepID=UPI0030DC20C2
MNIRYIYSIEYNEHFNEVILDFSLDKSLKNGYLITNSLGTDIFGDLAAIQEEIRGLLELFTGKVASYGGGGNVNLIHSDAKYTTFEDIFAEEGVEDPTCTIDTVEYMRIILVWAKRNVQYKRHRGVMDKGHAELFEDWINETIVAIDMIES